MSEEMDDYKLTESVEELRIKIEAMKKTMEEKDKELENGRMRRQKIRGKHSAIDGSFMSFVFVLVLFVIITVFIYTFFNFYHAIFKNYQKKKHSEL